MSTTSRPETRVPEDETPVVCPYCGFELPNNEQCRLHVGLEHYNELGEDEREAFKRNYTEEEAALNRFRIVALGALVVLYFGFLVVYAVLAV
ncbi:MAG: DNA-binding protein [Halohasta sp.]